jgi:hypothetical protein
MSEEYIQDWSGEHALRVATGEPESIKLLGPVVRISQDAGGLSFVHTLTTAQARQMAQTLIKFAREADGIDKNLRAKGDQS